MLLFGSDNPIASPTHAMVLAVNWPPHAPWPGHATFSSAWSSLSGQVPAAKLADHLEHVDDGDVLVVEAAGQDRPAIDEDRRDVEAQHRHHHARQRLVAPGEADQRVVAMAAHAELDRIGDDLAADQRGFHPLMPHRDAVGDGDRVEAARHAAILRSRPRARRRPGHRAEVLHGALSLPALASATNGRAISSSVRPIA